MSNSLSKAIVRLYDDERFYAELVLQMDKILSKSFPAVAGVCIKDRIKLYIQPERFDELTLPEQVAVLKHECKHILNDHISRAKELCPEVYEKNQTEVDEVINEAKHRLINIAADCSINPGIPGIGKNCMFPATFNLPDHNTMEWYVENLKNNKELEGLTHVDGHSLWKESDDSKEIIKEKIRQAINAAANKTRTAGKMTADLELLVDRINYKAKDWKSDLKRFAAKMTETALSSSKKKRNRRYGIMYPGVVKEEVLHLGVALDTSGSVSDEALAQFMAEVSHIAKYALVTVVEADSEIKNSYVFDPKKTYNIKGRGGTAYKPAFDFFSKQTEIDGVIYFGDMDCCDNEELTKPKYPVLWAVVGDQSPPASWGAKTKIEITQK